MVALRLWTAVNTPAEATGPDGRAYDRFALEIVEIPGLDFPSHLEGGYRPPLYPLFLAATYGLLGHNIIVVQFCKAQ